MFLTPFRIRKINVVVSALAMIAVPVLFAVFLRLSHQGILEAFAKLPITLLAMGLIVATSVLINYLTTVIVRKDQELKSLHVQMLFRNLFETAYNAIIIIDEDGTILSANTAAASLLAMPREHLEGENLYRHVAGGLCTASLEEASGQAGFCSLTLIRRDRSPAMTEAVCTPFEEGGSRRLLLILQDVTEKAAFEEKRRVLEQMATLGEMAARISHEINNPLMGIITFAESGLRKTGEEKTRSYFQSIREQAERITKITASYLQLARQRETVSQRLDIAEVVRKALTIFVITGQGKHLDIREEVAADLPAVLGDENKLLQVLLNLFVNAAHATEGRDERRLEVSVHPQDGQVVLRIGDNGCGIPPESLPRVFEPYYTTKPEGLGTGLGLAIAREIIVDDHGGSIGIDSVPGAGTTFTISLPASR